MNLCKVWFVSALKVVVFMNDWLFKYIYSVLKNNIKITMKNPKDAEKCNLDK